jgi:hypothetical protein
MRSNYLKETLKTAVLAVTILLLGVGVSVAQQQVNLTAGPTTLTMPDGSSVPMWGYSCGAAVTTPTPSLATCLNLNPYAPAATTTTPAGWSPVVITVPTTATGGLTINLTNSLTFGANSVPTSLVIVGQLGGGLGTTATTVASPDHSLAQQVTWPIASPGVAANTPPTQGPRVQSFSTEVAAGATTALTWATLKPGTYLIEVVRDPGGHHRTRWRDCGYSVSGSGNNSCGNLRRRNPLAVQRNRPDPEQCCPNRGEHYGIHRDRRMVRAARRLWRSYCAHLLSAGSELHAAVLPH